MSRSTVTTMIKAVVAAMVLAASAPLLTTDPAVTGAPVRKAAQFQLSTHVLDITSGTPRVGADVVLEKKSGDG